MEFNLSYERRTIHSCLECPVPKAGKSDYIAMDFTLTYA